MTCSAAFWIFLRHDTTIPNVLHDYPIPWEHYHGQDQPLPVYYQATHGEYIFHIILRTLAFACFIKCLHAAQMVQYPAKFTHLLSRYPPAQSAGQLATGAHAALDHGLHGGGVWGGGAKYEIPDTGIPHPKLPNNHYQVYDKTPTPTFQ